MLHGQLNLRNEVLAPRFRAAEALALQRVDRHIRNETIRPAAPEIEKYVCLTAIHDLAVVPFPARAIDPDSADFLRCHKELDRYRFYTYWGPLTAVLMIPWVAAFGLTASDNLINALFGAINVTLIYWMLRTVDRAGLRRIREPCCVALTVLFGLGTVHFWLSCRGSVWFAVQIATLTPLILSIIAICARRDSMGTCAMSGAMFGAAVLGRSIVATMGLFYLTVVWVRVRRHPGTIGPRLAARAVAFGLPLLVAGATQLAYNHGRFGSVLETGQGITARTGGEPRFRVEYERFGSFHPVFLARNLWHYFVNPNFPVVNGRRTFDPEGNSLFLITPPLLFVFLIGRRWDGFTAALLAGVIPLVVALLLFRATGFRQFGNRYLLDAMPLLLLLVATGMDGRLSAVGTAMIVAAVAMNTFGALRFHNELPRIADRMPAVYGIALLAAAGIAVFNVGRAIRGALSP